MKEASTVFFNNCMNLHFKINFIYLHKISCFYSALYSKDETVFVMCL